MHASTTSHGKCDNHNYMLISKSNAKIYTRYKGNGVI